MADLKAEVDPAEVGFDPRRLERVDEHFARYVEDGRLPGWLIVVSRKGKVAHCSAYGHRDKEAGLAVEVDTIWRIASMTKPITSVAAMILYEEGAFELSDPVSAFIPAFSEARVYRSGSAEDPVTEPTAEPVRIWHLLTHTAGLLGPANTGHPVHAMYQAAGFGPGTTPQGKDLAGCCDILAGLPLLFEPGTEWNYSWAHDVLGRVIEVASGQSLDRFMAERIFEPLGMGDTAFWVDRANAERLATPYVRGPDTGTAVRGDDASRSILERPTFLRGGAGLVSTAPDYHRFATMLLRQGELDGVHLLGPRTVRYMMANHLPGRADLECFGRPLFPPPTFKGMGFGLGLGVVDDPVANRVLCSAGAATWGGALSTEFWVDPHEDMVMVFMAQLAPLSRFSRLRQLVYQALFD